MRVKIGDEWFDSHDEPMMVVLSDKDKRNIANMIPEADRYAQFPNDRFSSFDMLEWMDVGY